MHGLYDIKKMNSGKAITAEYERRRLWAEEDRQELEQATDFVHRLRNNLLIDEHDRNNIADLLVSAYGVEED